MELFVFGYLVLNTTNILIYLKYGNINDESFIDFIRNSDIRTIEKLQYISISGIVFMIAGAL